MKRPAKHNPRPGLLRSHPEPALLAVVAVILYGATIGWGLPHATASDRTRTLATDSILPLEALAEMHSTFVVSKPDRNYGYPWWHYFVVASAQAPYVGLLIMTGQIEGVAPEYPYGMADPVTGLRWLTIIGRAVSILMSVGIVVAACLLASTLWNTQTGVVAGALTLLSYPMLYYSGTGNLDVPMAFWTALGLVCFARVLVLGLTTRRAIWLGVFAAIAMATKDQAFVMFFPLGLALLFPGIQGPRHGKYPWTPLLAGLATSVVVYGGATGMLVDPARHIEHVNRLLFRPEMLSVADAYFSPLPQTPLGFARLAWEFTVRLGDAVSIPVLIAATSGAAIAARSQPRMLVLLLPVPTMLLLINLPVGLVILRYFLPLVPVVSAFAALAVVQVRQRWKLAGTFALLLLVTWQALIGADLLHAQLRESRDSAAEWLETNAPSGPASSISAPRRNFPT